jgi:glycosyltransferase involved in cell wall biosynthesis
MDSVVGIFIHSFAGGGAERSAITLANSIAERGWRVQFIVQTIDGPFRKLLDPRADVLILGGRFRGLPFKMRRYLHRYQPEAVITFMTGFNIVAIIAAALSGWRGQLLVSERTSLQLTWAEAGYWRSWVLWGLMRLLYRRADRVVAVSQQLANDMVMQLDLPMQKVVAIPNPVPVEEIQRVSMVPVSHRFFSEGVPVLMAVGRLHSDKDYPTLVRAVADLRERQDVRLIVLGEGPARSELETLVKSLGLSEVVDLLGFVSPPWPWMARADVLVLSSWAEGWPNVLAEALALGVPVVATDCPTGPREILDGGRFGRLVPVGNVGEMSAAIEATLDNPPDRAILRGRSDEWSTARVVEAYLSILRAQGTV